MASPHQPFGLPDSDLPHQKYMYVCMYLLTNLNECSLARAPQIFALLASSQSKFFISAHARKKIAVLGMLANAHKDHSSPLLVWKLSEQNRLGVWQSHLFVSGLEIHQKLVRFLYNPIRLLCIHACFDSIYILLCMQQFHTKTICEKKHEIGACIINVWGYTEI